MKRKTNGHVAKFVVGEGYGFIETSDGSEVYFQQKTPARRSLFCQSHHRHFPRRAYVAPNVGNPFMGAHSFSSINAIYLHGIPNPSGGCASFNECFRRVHAMGDARSSSSQNGWSCCSHQPLRQKVFEG
jgi:hypothetical protein